MKMLIIQLDNLYISLQLGLQSKKYSKMYIFNIGYIDNNPYDNSNNNAHNVELDYRQQEMNEV